MKPCMYTSPSRETRPSRLVEYTYHQKPEKQNKARPVWRGHKFVLARLETYK